MAFRISSEVGLRCALFFAKTVTAPQATQPFFTLRRRDGTCFPFGIPEDLVVTNVQLDDTIYTFSYTCRGDTMSMVNRSPPTSLVDSIALV